MCGQKLLETVGKKKDLAREIEKLEKERARFVQLVSRATDQSVVATYEQRIGALVEKELVLKDSLMSLAEHGPNIETALDIVFDFLKNPLEQWKKGNIHTKSWFSSSYSRRILPMTKIAGLEPLFCPCP